MFETRRGRLACAVTLGVCVALAAESAHGQSIPGRDPAAEAEQAKAWFAEGQVALKAGRLAEACDAFEAAFQIKKHYQVAGALGTCELAQKRFAQAATHLLYALGEPRDVTPTSERARLEGLLASAEKHLAKLTIVTTEPLVDVTIGGRPVGRSPFPHPVYVLPGDLAFVAEAPGRSPKTLTEHVDAGQAATVRLVWDTPLPPDPFQAPAPAASAPTAAAPPPSSPPVVAHEPSEGGPSPLVVVVGGVLTLGALGAGTIFFFGAEDAADRGDAFLTDVTASRTPCPRTGKTGLCAELYQARVDEGDRDDLARGFLITAGALAAATGAYVLLTTSDETGPTARLIPQASAEGAGLHVEGSF
jgi:hypothetical protein